MGKVMAGVTTGAIIGAAVGMMVVPSLDRKTQRSLRKANHKMMNIAEDTYDTIAHLVK